MRNTLPVWLARGISYRWDDRPAYQMPGFLLFLYSLKHEESQFLILTVPESTGTLTLMTASSRRANPSVTS